jgi:hypothetical protein
MDMSSSLTRQESKRHLNESKNGRNSLKKAMLMCIGVLSLGTMSRPFTERTEIRESLIQMPITTYSHGLFPKLTIRKVMPSYINTKQRTAWVLLSRIRMNVIAVMQVDQQIDISKQSNTATESRIEIQLLGNLSRRSIYPTVIGCLPSFSTMGNIPMTCQRSKKRENGSVERTRFRPIVQDSRSAPTDSVSAFLCSIGSPKSCPFRNISSHLQTCNMNSIPVLPI